jgi:hypothetical protein
MDLTFELELPDGSVRPLTVLGAERPTIAQVERRLATALAAEGNATDAEDIRLRSPRLQRDLLGPRTLVREGIEDGERLLLRDTAASAPAAVAAAPPRAARPAMPALLAAVAVGAVIACAAFVLGAALDDDGPDPATTSASIGGFEEPVTEEVPVEEEIYEEPIAEEPVVEETPEPEPEYLDPAFEGGEWVQLASFRGAESAAVEAERLTAAGVDATVIDSADAQELFPGFQVVAAGPFASSADRRRTLRRAEAAGIPDAKARTLTPADTALDLATLSGSYTGEIELIDPSAPERNSTMEAGLFVDPDGSAQLSYEDPKSCNATLEQAGFDGAVGTWDQIVDGGDCLRGGTWRMKLSGSELKLAWQRDGSVRWMAGTLERDAG